MNVYERRRPARVGEKQVEQEQDICFTLPNPSHITKDHKLLIVGGLLLLLLGFIKGLILGRAFRR